jgi:hypothetical protein
MVSSPPAPPWLLHVQYGPTANYTTYCNSYADPSDRYSRSTPGRYRALHRYQHHIPLQAVLSQVPTAYNRYCRFFSMDLDRAVLPCRPTDSGPKGIGPGLSGVCTGEIGVSALDTGSSHWMLDQSVSPVCQDSTAQAETRTGSLPRPALGSASDSASGTFKRCSRSGQWLIPQLTASADEQRPSPSVDTLLSRHKGSHTRDQPLSTSHHDRIACRSVVIWVGPSAILALYLIRLALDKTTYLSSTTRLQTGAPANHYREILTFSSRQPDGTAGKEVYWMFGLAMALLLTLLACLAPKVHAEKPCSGEESEETSGDRA